MIKRPITPLDEFEKALKEAKLSDKDYELIEYIRYTSVRFSDGWTNIAYEYTFKYP